MNYALVTYVDTRDTQVKEEAISTAINSAKTYTDTEVDTLETSLKQYCDDGHQQLQDAIDENATKINEISNTSNNGVLDVLHKEFHDLINGFTEQQIVNLLKSFDERITALENA